MQSQNDEILDYLKEGNSLTAIEALNSFKCFRLASRINDLKNRGYSIESKTIKAENGKRYASYSLQTIKEEKGQLIFA